MGAQLLKREGGTGTRRRRARSGRRMGDINITSFVDVSLVLLIVFMITAPMLTVGVPIELPRTAAGALPGEQEEPLTITLSADGTVMIQASEVAADDLIPQLRAVAAERASNRVFLRADGAIPYSQVVQVMGALNAGGFHNIGLVTESGGPGYGSDRAD
jgi:biopolymer transport protein TolR